MIGCTRTHDTGDLQSLGFISEDEVLTLDQTWPSPNGTFLL